MLTRPGIELGDYSFTPGGAEPCIVCNKNAVYHGAVALVGHLHLDVLAEQ